MTHLLVPVNMVVHDVPPQAGQFIRHDALFRADTRPSEVCPQCAGTGIRSRDEVTVIGPDWKMGRVSPYLS